MDKAIFTYHEKNNKSFILYGLLDENRKYKDFQLFPADDSIVNDIYVARVGRILKGINGAFVNISPKQSCYISLNDLSDPVYVNKKSKKPGIHEGDEILVQIVKDAIKTKEPVASTKLCIFGDHMIISTTDTSLGVSGKINRLRANEIKKVLDSVCKMHETENFGVVVRTSAASIPDEQLIADFKKTYSIFNAIMEKSAHSLVYTKLYQSSKDYIMKLKSLDMTGIENVVTDQKELYDNIYSYMSDSAISNRLKLYDDSAISLSSLYGIRSIMENLTSRMVWLKSGANIIIEQLETLTFIDVNTSGSRSLKSNSIFSVNEEAAKEAAKQLKLRNISGMIIIDFINMKNPEEKNELIKILKEEIKKDCVTCTFIDITKLGLVELTRKKRYKSLKEIIYST